MQGALSFVVYILLGKNNNGKDVIYVGKSKNGLKNRPTAHEDKYPNWTVCYILTQFKERTFFNDGSIQYLEDEEKRYVMQKILRSRLVSIWGSSLFKGS